MPKGDAPKAEAPKAEPPKVADAKQAAPGKTAPADDATRYLLQAGALPHAGRRRRDARAPGAARASMPRSIRSNRAARRSIACASGPYGSIDDINRIRKLMAENNIEAQVVRLK